MLQLNADDREALWEQLTTIVEDYVRNVDDMRVAPELDPGKIRDMLKPLDFSHPVAPADAVRIAAEGLSRFQVHTPHPSYFGLFNPAPTTMGIAADLLVAAFNPQMAAWSHNPFAAEVEMHLVRQLGTRFGYDRSNVDGTFASGGMEANHTALLCALTHHFEDFPLKGIRAMNRQPVFYVSSESHHSFLKAARLCGIGMECVRHVEVDEQLKMRPDALEEAIEQDRRAGFAPFLVVATAGTTNAGVLDPIADCAGIAERAGLWYHVDAAWGGGAVFVPELKSLLSGIERADSITFDAHKWLSVPMGAGIFLTRDTTALDRTFRVATAYMPKEAEGLDIVDPHLHSMQWSRRFIGLKVFLSLLVAGWDGYAETIRHQTAMGDRLRERLRDSGWHIANGTPLPVVCFGLEGVNPQDVVNRVVTSGEAWISSTLLAGKQRVIRACITNYRTGPEHVDALVESLQRARG